ncbi:protein LAZY 1-like [Carya illinoinensis]|uniref:protein LAZY 1-like n=1 Tax=Carya illinoinensis TaxID=32201 RepID=UPI001C7283E8|nr:protein LAZY 1-like [Carya illinoinensis]
MHHVKKMLKKLHASSRNSVPSNSGDAAESISTKKILRKVIRMFHKKIHPETTIAARDFADSHTNKVNNAPNRCYNNKEHMYPGADNNGFTLGSMSKMGIPCHKSNLKPPQDRLHGSNLSAKEHWIKTDAEYLVLEL